MNFKSLIYERSHWLHVATSYKGATPTDTAKNRIFAYKQAEKTHNKMLEYWSNIPEKRPEVPKHLRNGTLRLQSFDGTTARYVPVAVWRAEQYKYTDRTRLERLRVEEVMRIELIQFINSLAPF
jgi:hypothetical protein